MLEANDIAFIVQILDKATVSGINNNAMLVGVFQKLQQMAKAMQPVSSPAVAEGVKQVIADKVPVIDPIDVDDGEGDGKNAA
jgi:hypothetical protein